MPPDTRRAIRDPIHGLIPRNPDEIRLMNTAAFQRLRRIRQLALAHHVYPSALHTRFEHSVGTMYVAGRICARLGELSPIDDDTTRLVRLAALVHDVGHGPFSHVSEFVLDRYYDREALGDLGQTAKIHERITGDLLRVDSEIAAVLSQDERQSIIDLLGGLPVRRFERDIVSSSLDADKMDYLLRDGYFAGVQYGQFDLDKIIDVCRVISRGGESYLAFDEEGIYALEQLVVAKYHMGQQVYYHRIRAITDAMLVRGLCIAVRDGVDGMDRAYSYDGTDAFLESYMALDDEVVLFRLSNCEHPIVRDIFSRLRSRRLLKEISTIAINDVADAIKKDRLSTLRPILRITPINPWPMRICSIPRIWALSTVSGVVVANMQMR